MEETDAIKTYQETCLFSRVMQGIDKGISSKGEDLAAIIALHFVREVVLVNITLTGS